MSSSAITDLDRTYHQQPETLAAAARYLESTGNADLLLMLGLVDEPAKPTVCAMGHPLSQHGGCRRTDQCRADTDRLAAARQEEMR